MDNCIALSRKQVAERLGVSLPSVDKLLHRPVSPLPSIKTASGKGRGRILVPVVGLERWIENEMGNTNEKG